MRCLAAVFLGISVLASPPLTHVAQAFVWPSSPERAKRALQGSDVAERRAAALALGDMAEATADPLLRLALADSDTDVRLGAAKSAVRLRSTAASEAVIPWLSDSDVKVRLAACELIRYVPTPRAVLALGRVLGDPDGGVRLAAASAMGASGAPEAVGPLLGHLDDPSVNVRGEIAQALARIGDISAAVPLIGKIGDGAPEVRRAVARALGELGDPRASSALILALRDPVPSVRIEALAALGRLASAEAVLSIAPLLDDRTSPEVRVAALTALGHIGSEAAVRTLVKALASEDPTTASSPVREALEISGARAIPQLMAAVTSFENANVAAGAARVLGAVQENAAAPVIAAALRKGSVGPYAALRALSDLGDPTAVPTVLEFLSDANPMVRRQAVLSVAPLLDPSRHDGRAVEPLVSALHDPRSSAEEQELLARALGRTGSPRALGVLLALVTSKSLALRVAALDALGTLGPAGQDRELLFALEDDNASVRLHAAMALSLAGGPDSVHTLLARLTQGATEDRTAIGLALSGALSRSREETAREIEPLLIASGAAVRDALIEGLGRMSGPTAGTVLAELLKHALETPDRSKIAEALAGHPEQRRAITALLADADPEVRAEAVWASGISPSGTGDPGWFARATQLMSDSDLDAASNATAAVALLARASNDDATKQGAVVSLCKAEKHPRAYVRANALAGLALLGARCEGGAAERRALLDDPSETVRAAAARSIGRTGPGTGTGGPRVRDDQRALSRCVADDKSGMVANACRGLGPRSPETAPLLVFVVPDGKSSPVPLAPYSLLRADGFIRSGRADRRGAIFERALPKGEVTLLVPAALAP